ncbi:hypothetical protein [Verrucosispora sp. WMMD1129]|uniref:hypothetical protein n=1 Tax=Verrucosispora sp. WMMD1129 TaxID=3016093 RepID=UPI00249B1DA2|nr:hypothetical protein [Verrucosispora sp. WMMD1129]WFE43573.1 hypothetical protein O7624_04125 [Verrucosispora sp. WMMD1129]
MSAPVPTSGSFTFEVPEGWLDYDLAGQDFSRQQRELRAAVSTAEQRSAVDDALRQARRLLRAARQQGAAAAAGMIARDDDGGLLMAFVAAFGITVPDGTQPSVADIAQQLTRPAGINGHGDRTVTSATLPTIGTVARITGTEVVELTESTSAVMVAMHTIIPVPGQPGSYLVVTGMSPNLPLADALYDVFDAITGTLRFT